MGIVIICNWICVLRYPLIRINCYFKQLRRPHTHTHAYTCRNRHGAGGDDGGGECAIVNAIVCLCTVRMRFTVGYTWTQSMRVANHTITLDGCGWRLAVGGWRAMPWERHRMGSDAGKFFNNRKWANRVRGIELRDPTHRLAETTERAIACPEPKLISAGGRASCCPPARAVHPPLRCVAACVFCEIDCVPVRRTRPAIYYMWTRGKLA